MEEVLTVKDVARELNVKPGCIYLRVNNHELSHFRVGNRIRVYRSDLNEYINRMRETAEIN